ncbi:MAG: NERD domain-containing protein [Planktothrix agardhii LY1]|uniref:nuclease-related domain-containing DEAD/DEAH box helicase n=1 Tax=Planktothrix agardhii TaxID=1160 RepID=UPI0024323D80|nr:NERD domain-containing protein [Planktothrix agardhii]MCP9294197.1 NERD domain-containing protein [Planktothrix agardhii LY1]
MAKMFPPDGPSNPNLYGESQVYHLLAKLEDDFYIFQDRHWIFTNKEGCRTERETDFLLVHPQKGLLIIEVKGGTKFSYDGEHDQWKSGDNQCYKNPYKKQLANSRKLPLFLKETIPSLKNFWFTCGYAICFPKIDDLEGNLAPFMERKVTLFKYDLDNLDCRINEIYSHYINPIYDRPLGKQRVEEIKNLITPKSVFRKSLSAELDDEKETIIQLTKEQREILDGFYRVNQPILIEGPAGTGKTQLAISQAISDIKSNKFVLFITNSPQSQYYIYQEISLNIQLNHDSLTILHSKEVRRVNDILTNQNNGKEIRIIVDEAQQLDANLLRYLADYSEKILHISIIIFKDDSQKTNENNIEQIFQPFNYTLQKVIRNTIEIFDSYKEYISPTYKVKKPVRTFKEVIKNFFIAEKDLIDALQATLINMTKYEKICPKNITILFSEQPTESIAQSIQSSINPLSFKKYSLASPIHPQTITWSTVYEFQGLENHIILLVELDPEPISETIRLRRLRYIGRSRAWSILHLFLRKDISSDITNIADIF